MSSRSTRTNSVMPCTLKDAETGSVGIRTEGFKGEPYLELIETNPDGDERKRARGEP